MSQRYFVAYTSYMSIQSLQSTTDLCQEFLAHVKHNRALPTWKFYKFYLDKFITQVPNNFNELKSFHLQKFSDYYRDNTKRNCIRSVKSCFTWLQDQDYIDHSPFQKVKRPQEIFDDACLTPEQYQQILTITTGKFKEIIVFMRLSGIRVSEMRQLHSDFLQDHAFIIPRKQSKGARTERTILLTNEAHEMIKSKIGFIFTNRYGKPYTANSLHHHCKQISKIVGFPFHLGLLRKYFIVQSLVAGVDVISLSRIVGHSDLKTMNLYYAKLEARSQHLRDMLDRCTTPQS